MQVVKQTNENNEDLENVTLVHMNRTSPFASRQRAARMFFAITTYLVSPCRYFCIRPSYLPSAMSWKLD